MAPESVYLAFLLAKPDKKKGAVIDRPLFARALAGFLLAAPCELQYSAVSYRFVRFHTSRVSLDRT